MVHNFCSMGRLVNRGYREVGIALHGVGKTVEEAKEDIRRCYHFPQILYMSCGYKLPVQSHDALPKKDTLCPCGNPSHWIVKYELPKQPFYRRVLNGALRYSIKRRFIWQ